MEEFYFTFGVQYRTNPHPSVVDGVRPDPDGWWTIVAPDEDAARAKMNELVGERWAFCYQASLDSFGKLDYYPKGEMLRIKLPE